ncbi:MAG: hypothetical protein K0R83_1785, partial [Caulobacter sp.]|nr:hypothetical protein [Caulobacter sp.]
MSVTNRARRRVSLLASSSLVAASLLAGVAGLTSLAVAPGVALAADECGDPSANAGANDVLTCAGAYANIDYTATTNGNLTLNLEDGVVVTNGIAVTGNAGEILTVRATTNVVGSGDPTVVNPAGYAINVQGQGATVNIDLRSSDVGVDGLPGPDIGTTRGINATNSVGTVQVRMNEGAVNASAGFGINAVGVDGVVINLTNGTTVTASGAAVRGVSSSGVVDIFTSGQITSDNTGIFASGADGAFVESGAVTGGAAGAGIQAQSSGGPAVVTTHGAVSGFQGIIANSGGGGASVVDLGGTVTGTGGAGVTQNVGATGSMILQSNGNAIVGATDGVVQISSASSTVEAYVGDVTASAGNGVDVTASAAGALVVVSSTGLITASGSGVNVNTGGDATVSVTDVTAGTGYGVLINAGGVATVNVSGTVTGAGGVGAQSGGADDATVNLLAGSTTTGTDGFSYGALAQATGTGDAFVIAEGDVLDGGVGAFAGSGSANVTGAGDIA